METDTLRRVNELLASMDTPLTWDWAKKKLAAPGPLDEFQQGQLNKAQALLEMLRERFSWNQHTYTFSALPPLSKQDLEQIRLDNAKLQKLLLAVQQTYDNYKSQGGDPSPADLADFLRGKTTFSADKRTILAAFDLVQEDMLQRKCKPSTLLNNAKAKARLKLYLKHLQRTKLLCDEIDRVWCRRYERWLLAEGLSGSTAMTYIAKVIRALHLAVDEGYCKGNKAAGYRYLSQRVTPEKRSLALAELVRIEQHDYAHPTLRKVADIFTFCAYTGLSYADYRRFAENPQEFISTESGVVGIGMVRQKLLYRNKGFWVPLFAGARAILRHYNGALPLYGRGYIGRQLKAVGREAGVSLANLTHKDARSTFAQLVRDRYGRELASGMAGHSEQIAEKHYSSLSPQRIVEQLTVLGTELTHN
jgi:hypothetical protein